MNKDRIVFKESANLPSYTTRVYTPCLYLFVAMGEIFLTQVDPSSGVSSGNFEMKSPVCTTLPLSNYTK